MDKTSQHRLGAYININMQVTGFLNWPKEGSLFLILGGGGGDVCQPDVHHTPADCTHNLLCLQLYQLRGLRG